MLGPYVSTPSGSANSRKQFPILDHSSSFLAYFTSSVASVCSLSRRPVDNVGNIGTAVLCSNDMTAMGVMRKSYTEGIVIPRDLSVIGFDNVRISQFMLPPLSTIEMSQAEIARIAFRALLEEVQRSAPNPKGTEYVLQTNLVLRESTALSSKWVGPRQREV